MKMYQTQIPQTNYSNYYQQQLMRNVMPQQGLKGRPVSSLDEVRATAVDFDGSISYFPSLANDTIYTKQINLDGTSSIKIYELVETPSTQAAAFPAMNNLVTKEEFSKTINSLLQEIAQLKEEKEQNQEKPQQEFNF